MRFRKLRIAFSATCLIACVLLIVLWVRSYWRFIGVRGMVGNCFVIIETERGESTLNVVTKHNAMPALWYSMPVELDKTNHQDLPRSTRGRFGVWW